MILSRYFVFIHLPKTGGTFVRKILGAHAPGEWETLEVVALGGPPRNDPNHPTVRDIPTPYRGRPIFGFVRNPWDWYVSWYEFLKIDGGNRLFNEASEHGRRDFAGTLQRIFDTPMARQAGIGVFTWYFRESFGPDPNRIRFLRFENLRRELLEALQSVAAVPPELARALEREPPINTTRRARYQDYYTPELRRLIASKDRDLIRRFGYHYE